MPVIQSYGCQKLVFGICWKTVSSDIQQQARFASNASTTLRSSGINNLWPSASPTYDVVHGIMVRVSIGLNELISGNGRKMKGRRSCIMSNERKHKHTLSERYFPYCLCCYNDPPTTPCLLLSLLSLSLSHSLSLLSCVERRRLTIPLTFLFRD